MSSIFLLLITDVIGFEPIPLVLETNILAIKLYIHKAGVAGIEPASLVLETIILPLNYTPICAQRDLNPHAQGNGF